MISLGIPQIIQAPTPPEPIEAENSATKSEETQNQNQNPLVADEDASPTMGRQRRSGVVELSPFQFQSVKQLAQRYQKMYEETTRKLQQEGGTKSGLATKQPVDEAHLLPPPSGYCSSSASGGSDDERFFERKLSVKRSGSSDSAVGLTPSDDERPEAVFYSPYSPRGSVDHTNVPTRTLIESQFVPCPNADLRKFSDCAVSEDGRGADSRRQSVFTDDGDDSRCRFWRTPSVVVSDYSDDLVGLTLEDIEYFRSQRKEPSSSPDSSLHSSCSNLNYCGSSISNLDSEHLMRKPYRKTSDCSLYSLSGDEDDNNLQPVSSKERVSCFPLSAMRAKRIFPPRKNQDLTVHWFRKLED